MKLTPDELELLQIIRDNEDPERALIIALKIITEYLQHLQLN